MELNTIRAEIYKKEEEYSGYSEEFRLIYNGCGRDGEEQEVFVADVSKDKLRVSVTRKCRENSEGDKSYDYIVRSKGKQVACFEGCSQNGWEYDEQQMSQAISLAILLYYGIEFNSNDPTIYNVIAISSLLVGKVIRSTKHIAKKDSVPKFLVEEKETKIHSLNHKERLIREKAEDCVRELKKLTRNLEELARKEV